MKLGRNVGTVVCTCKDPKLHGKKLYLVLPLTDSGEPAGDILVAIDAVGSGCGETVFYITHREAVYAFEGEEIPSDATIVGIVDQITGMGSIP